MRPVLTLISLSLLASPAIADGKIVQATPSASGDKVCDRLAETIDAAQKAGMGRNKSVYSPWSTACRASNTGWRRGT